VISNFAMSREVNALFLKMIFKLNIANQTRQITMRTLTFPFSSRGSSQKGFHSGLIISKLLQMHQQELINFLTFNFLLSPF
jgi:hypothetical protein